MGFVVKMVTKFLQRHSTRATENFPHEPTAVGELGE